MNLNPLETLKALPELQAAMRVIPPKAPLDPRAGTMGFVPPDPGPHENLCYTFTNTGVCRRIAQGMDCKFRHLPPTHPDVITDKLNQGKSVGHLQPAYAMSANAQLKQALGRVVFRLGFSLLLASDRMLAFLKSPVRLQRGLSVASGTPQINTTKGKINPLHNIFHLRSPCLHRLPN